MSKIAFFLVSVSLVFLIVNGGHLLGQGPAAVTCVKLESKTCKDKYGANPGNNPPINCVSTCVVKPLDPDWPIGEVMYVCNQLAHSEFSILDNIEWKLTERYESQPFSWPVKGVLASQDPSFICKIEETCDGCEWNEATASMKCKVTPIISALEAYWSIRDNDGKEIPCDSGV